MSSIHFPSTTANDGGLATSSGPASSDGTICFFFRFGPANADFNYIWSSNLSTGEGHTILTDGTGLVIGYEFEDAGFTTFATLVLNTWYFLAATFKGSATTIYFKKVGAPSLTVGTATGGTYTPATVSFSKYFGSGFRFVGDMASAMLWDGQVLTQPQLELQSRSLTPIQRAGLWGYWPLTGKSDLRDFSGGRRDLAETTPGTNTTSISTPPVPGGELDVARKYLLFGTSGSGAIVPWGWELLGRSTPLARPALRTMPVDPLPAIAAAANLGPWGAETRPAIAARSSQAPIRPTDPPPSIFVGKAAGWESRTLPRIPAVLSLRAPDPIPSIFVRAGAGWESRTLPRIPAVLSLRAPDPIPSIFVRAGAGWESRTLPRTPAFPPRPATDISLPSMQAGQLTASGWESPAPPVPRAPRPPAAAGDVPAALLSAVGGFDGAAPPIPRAPPSRAAADIALPSMTVPIGPAAWESPAPAMRGQRPQMPAADTPASLLMPTGGFDRSSPPIAPRMPVRPANDVVLPAVPVAAAGWESGSAAPPRPAQRIDTAIVLPSLQATAMGPWGWQGPAALPPRAAAQARSADTVLPAPLISAFAAWGYWMATPTATPRMIQRAGGADVLPALQSQSLTAWAWESPTTIGTMRRAPAVQPGAPLPSTMAPWAPENPAPPRPAPRAPVNTVGIPLAMLLIPWTPDATAPLLRARQTPWPSPTTPTPPTPPTPWAWESTSPTPYRRAIVPLAIAAALPPLGGIVIPLPDASALIAISSPISSLSALADPMSRIDLNPSVVSTIVKV
jgi:hypothetical protein